MVMSQCGGRHPNQITTGAAPPGAKTCRRVRVRPPHRSQLWIHPSSLLHQMESNGWQGRHHAGRQSVESALATGRWAVVSDFLKDPH